MKKSKSFQKKPEKMSEDTQRGLLVASYGQTAEVEGGDGNIYRCHLRKNLPPIAAGDTVLWTLEKDNTGIVVDFLPRTSLLGRPEPSGKIKPIAANIDSIIIVSALPVLSEHLIDRYLVAAENLSIKPILLVNKTDLIDDKDFDAVRKDLEPYEKIGYQVIFSSAYKMHGLETLEDFIVNKTCVLVGASGVGKSSIIASFIPDEYVRVGETSAKGIGKHTTTMTRLYRLPHGGNLIDSPGVREFALWHMQPHEILLGFVEFKPYLLNCKFRDCKHLKEPGCAIKQAVEENKISAQRYESFKEMILGK